MNIALIQHTRAYFSNGENTYRAMVKIFTQTKNNTVQMRCEGMKILTKLSKYYSVQPLTLEMLKTLMEQWLQYIVKDNCFKCILALSNVL